jgi:PAS domain S-box-containing protein
MRTIVPIDHICGKPDEGKSREELIQELGELRASLAAAELINHCQPEETLREYELRYRSLLDSIDQGFCIIEVIFDENGKPIDYRFLEVNPSFEKQTGLIDAQGRRMRDLRPKHEEHWFEIYGQIALTGQPARFQNRAEQLHRWYDVYAFRFGQPENRQVAILFNDITERKQAEETLKDSEKKFRLIAENSADYIFQLIQKGGLFTALHLWNASLVTQLLRSRESPFSSI